MVDALLACGVPESTTALITICVAVPIALGVVVLGAVRFQVVTILVGIFILWATWQLFDARRRGALASHPMFAFTHAQQQHHHQTAEAAAASAGGGGVNPFSGHYVGGYRTQQPVLGVGYPAAAPVQGFRA